MAERGTYTYDFPRPSVTVDVVAFMPVERSLKALFIRRRHPPFEGCWALPGGFVDPSERLPVAAARELAEETGLRANDLWPVGGFGDPGRDPRGWTISFVYYTLIAPGGGAVTAADDAKEVSWLSVDDDLRLGFDHGEVLRSALAQMRRDLYALPVAAPMTEELFTIASLHKLYSVLDPNPPKSAVLKRRLIDAAVIETVEGGKLYRFRR